MQNNGRLINVVSEGLVDELEKVLWAIVEKAIAEEKETRKLLQLENKLLKSEIERFIRAYEGSFLDK